MIESDEFEYEYSNEWLDEYLKEIETVQEPEADPYQYILGLDPGETTGVAMLRIDTRDDKVKPELVYLHQITGGRYGFKDWFAGSVVSENLVIVSEKWRERNIKGANREPQYIEGAMHMLWDDDNIEYQFPDVKELIPDQWLKDNNLWTEGKRHQMDAQKHAWAYLRNQEHSATLDSLSGEDQEPMAQPGTGQKAQIEDGTPEDGDGDGGEGGTPQDAAEAFAQAMQELADAVQEAAEAMEALGSGQGDGEADSGEPRGPGAGGYGSDETEDTRKRTKRSRNGAFAGFNPVDYEEGTTLLDD